MTTQNTLGDLIDKMVAEKTFGLDALDAVRALKLKAVEQDKVIAGQKDAIAGYHAEAVKQSARIREFEGAELKITAREIAVAKREEKITELEKSEAVSKAKAETIRDVFGVIFKNTTVRENNLRLVPHTYSQNGQSNTHFVQQPETVERTSE